MILEEEDFPRGGVIQRVAEKPKRKNDEDLFKASQTGSKQPRKRTALKSEDKSGRKKKKNFLETAASSPGKKKPPGVEFLTHRMITSGMLILGCVKEVRKFDLLVSLPNHMTGIVKITNVNDAYTNMLKKLTESDEDEVEVPPSLSDLFSIGMLVHCKVLEDGKVGQKIGHYVRLSLKPSEVNSIISPETLVDGMVISGNILSEEDHGFIVDLGIPGINAFIKNKQAKAFCEEANRAIHVGSLLQCCIKLSDNAKIKPGKIRTVDIRIDQKTVSSAKISDLEHLNIDTMLPGQIFETVIDEVMDDGLLVSCHGYKCCIPRTHFQDSKKLKPMKKIQGCLLFVNQHTKVLSLSCLPHLMAKHANESKIKELQVGQIIDAAELISKNKVDVRLKLPNGAEAVVYKTQLSDEESKQIPGDFQLGIKHKCRIMELDYLENVVIASLKKSILEETIIGYDEIKIGMKVKVKIREIAKEGVVVKLSRKIQGFIPNAHLSDVVLSHPEKVFHVDDEIKCLVISVNVEKKNVILSCKKSLLKSKTPPITSYSQLQVGDVLQAVVSKILNKGIKVKLFGEVKGFVPRGMLSIDVTEVPENVFHIGQVVKCQVHTVDPESEKLILTFKLDSKQRKMKKIKLPDDFAIGKITKCKVEAKTPNGLTVTLLPSGLAAHLPKAHLSDHPGMCKLIHDSTHVGDVLKEVVYINASNMITVSMKPVFIQTAKAGKLISDFSKLEPGILAPGYVMRKMNYGVFVDLLNGLVGLVPHKFCVDRYLPDPLSLFDIGQSVVAKVTEVDMEKSRFLMSLRMQDCYHGETDTGISLLAQYFQEWNKTLKSLLKTDASYKHLLKNKVGQIVTITVTKCMEQGILCCCKSSGVQGFVTEDHMGDVQCKKGDELQAVVLYVDTGAKCLELSVQPALVSSVQNLAETPLTEARIDQLIKSEVQLIKPEFILVSLRGHAQGRFAYLPARRHLNDVLEQHQFVIGQVNQVVIHSSDLHHTLASLKIHDPNAKKLGNLVVNQKVVAKVRKVLDDQVYVSSGNMNGRLFINEISDEPVEGQNPIKENITPGSSIEVKVIGFRNTKEPKFRLMSVSRSKEEGFLFEASMRKSVMEAASTEELSRLIKQSYSRGEKVIGYLNNIAGDFLWMTLNQGWRGRLPKKNLPNDPKIYDNIGTYFNRGCAYTAIVTKVISDDLVNLTMKEIELSEALAPGSIVEGKVISASDQSGLIVSLPNNCRGHVALTDIADEYSENLTEALEDTQVKCQVLGTHKAKMYLSTRPSRINTKKDERPVDEELKIENLSGKVVRGFVKSASAKGVFIRLAWNIVGRASLENTSQYFIVEPQTMFSPGRLVTAKVIKVRKENGATEYKIDLSLLEKDTGVADQVPTDQASDYRKKETAKKANKRKQKVEKKEEGDVIPVKKSRLSEIPDRKEQKTGRESSLTPDQKASTKTKARLSLSDGFSWDDDNFASQNKSPVIDSDSSDEEEEISEKPAPVPKKLSKAQAVLFEEKELMQREKELQSNQLPQSVVDFDRLLLQSPNSSMVWLRYMAYHLEMTEYDKARTVAERALKTISFREEQEKFNIWVAYLNLENSYGTDESLKEVFDRAVQHNEPVKVFKQMIAIYDGSKKVEEAELLIKTMVKKYSAVPVVWIDGGHFFFKNQKPDKARELLQRSLKSLEKNNHVETIAKFAEMEFKLGEPDRGKTMFENILSSYPKRTDLWYIYIDMVIKIGEIDNARMLYERLINLKHSVKKMRTLFKKYLQFEERFGDSKTIDDVKRKAVEYVDNQAKE